jgi:hypothetical protein
MTTYLRIKATSTVQHDGTDGTTTPQTRDPGTHRLIQSVLKCVGMADLRLTFYAVLAVYSHYIYIYQSYSGPEPL